MAINHLIAYRWKHLWGGKWLVGPNPTDRGKSGTKRHVLVDQKGIPLSVVITGANIHDDMKASINTLDKIVVHKPVEKHNLCLDKGYDFPEIQRIYQKKIRSTYSS